MGTWNTGILGNDSAKDIYGFFEELYNKQELDIEQIKIKTLSEFDLLNKKNEPVFGNEEWLAYALICWECQALDDQTMTIVNRIIENKEAIKEEWEDLAEKRIIEIQKLITKIQTPSQKKKRIRKEHVVNVPFQEGDCLVFKYDDNMYSAYILLDIDNKKYLDKPNMWTYFIATTRIYSQIKPTMEDIINSHILVLNYGRNIDGEQANWINSPELSIWGRFIGRVKSEKERLNIEQQFNDYEVIGNLQFKKKPTYHKYYGGFFLSDKGQLKSQFEWERTNLQSINLSYPIKKYIANKRRWKFWTYN